MKKVKNPKLAAPVETERLIRDFLDAFSSLKTVGGPPTCSHPAEEEQRPEQFQEGWEQPCELVGGGALPSMSEKPGPVPPPPLETLKRYWATSAALSPRIPRANEPGSDIDEEESEQISALHGAGHSEPCAYQIEAPKKNHREIIEEFCGDDNVLERLRVTPAELRELSRASMLGTLTNKQDVLFMLRIIREPRKPAEPRTTVPSEPPYIQSESIEQSVPDISEMLDRLRREALLNLPRWHPLTDAKRSRLGQFSAFSSALALVTEITRRIKMMLNWRNRSSAKLLTR